MTSSAQTPSPTIEPAHSTHHHMLCWKSTFAGVLISLMAYMLLTSLGAGVEGMTAQHLASPEKGFETLSTGASVWLVLSAAVALFCGSYFTLRIAGFVTNRVGAAHAFVVASIFFILLNTTTGMAGYFFGRVTTDPSRVIADAGWSLFCSFFIGLVAAVIGGRVGAHANVTRPFSLPNEDHRQVRRTYVSATNTL